MEAGWGLGSALQPEAGRAGEQRPGAGGAGQGAAAEASGRQGRTGGLTRTPSLRSGFAAGPLTEGSAGGPATPPWRERPICKGRFPADSDKDALDDHMDGHFFFSTQDPFTFE